jgi:transposase
MSGFIEGESRTQATMFPERIDDYIAEENAVRVIDVFVDELDLSGLGFKTIPELTGRPACHPAIMLKLYIYGYLNRIQSSRPLRRKRPCEIRQAKSGLLQVSPPGHSQFQSLSSRGAGTTHYRWAFPGGGLQGSP